MTRRLRHEPKPERPINPGGWKPKVCQEPGCDTRHPCASHDGTDGPWRCWPCHLKTGPKAPTDPFADIPAPPEPAQGSLL